MASDTPAEDAHESPAQRQARLRRERRNAKLQAGGSERLNKITSLNGRPATEEPGRCAGPQVPVRNETTDSPLNAAPAHRANPIPSSIPIDDPPEIDINNAFQQPARSEQQSLEDQQALFRQMLRQPPPGSAPDQASLQQDPMMAMMQQILGQNGSGAAAGTPGTSDGSMDALPPALANMFGGGGSQPQAPINKIDYVWRIVHGLYALSIAIYAAMSLTFESSSFLREHATAQELAPRVFWAFTTGQLLLQGTRYIVDAGHLPPGSLMSSLASILPQPYANYIRTASRYSIIYTTIMSDAMLIVFVMGFMAWYTGQAAS